MDYEKIKTVEDAASSIGVRLLTEEEHGNLLGLPKSMARNNYLHYLLTIVCRAINGSWKTNWNSKKYIWQIWCFVPTRLFSLSKDDPRLITSDRGPLHAAASCGVSLALKDRDRFNYVIEQFGDLWIEYLTGIK